MGLINLYLSLFYSIFQINFYKLILLYDKKAVTVLWIYWPFKRWLFPDIGLIYDLIYIQILIKNNINFKLISDNKIGSLSDHNIFLNLNRKYNTSGFKNSSQVIADRIKYLELQNNRVYPSSSEAIYWENKVFMYESFERLGVKTPNTIILKDCSDLKKVKKLNFPVISKIPHGAGSSGIIEYMNFSDINALEYPIIFQERLKMSSDARVVVISGKIVDCYFRVNTQKKWHPTSTSFGSKLQYFDLTTSVQNYLITLSEKLNLRVAAFDITWLNDEYFNDNFYILEVSPAYMPNPKYNGNLSYIEWKKRILIRNPYWKEFVKSVYEQRTYQLNAYYYS